MWRDPEPAANAGFGRDTIVPLTTNTRNGTTHVSTASRVLCSVA